MVDMIPGIGRPLFKIPDLLLHSAISLQFLYFLLTYVIRSPPFCPLSGLSPDHPQYRLPFEAVRSPGGVLRLIAVYPASPTSGLTTEATSEGGLLFSGTPPGYGDAPIHTMEDGGFHPFLSLGWVCPLVFFSPGDSESRDLLLPGIGSGVDRQWYFILSLISTSS